MTRLQALATLLLVSLALSCGPAALPGNGRDAGLTVAYRDTWGVPHIYAPDAPSGCYAMGWLQAEDRPQELLKNFLRGMGEIASVEGEVGLQSDWVARVWDHYGTAQRGLSRVGEAVRPCLAQFVQGINDFYALHPEDLPDWWGHRPVDEAMVLAFARYFLYSWSIDDGFGDLARGGVEPRLPPAQRGSNQFAVAPQRSAAGAAILAIDPHLYWWGPSRFWEFRIHAGELQGSGVTLPGFPTIGLGHNQYLAWSMTTGGPDTADAYRLELSPDDPLLYRYDGTWRRMAQKDAEIRVRGESEPRRVELLASVHGPVVAVQGTTAYAIRMSYADEIGILDAWWTLNHAAGYLDAQAALDTLQFFPQNVMVADVEGNIYYQRTGRVPRRPPGFDWSRPVDGSTPKSEWREPHEASDLVQLLNPPQGYMQNCNVPPDAMLRNSPLVPERYAGYIYSDRGHGPLGGWSNPRGARAVELLEARAQLSVVEAMDVILDVQPFGVSRWMAALREAVRLAGEGYSERASFRAAADQLQAWDGQLKPDSQPALLYYYWRRLLQERADPHLLSALAARLDNFREPLGVVSQPPAVTPAEAETMCRALAMAIERRREELGAPGRAYGDVFRVGRGVHSWPVGGGGPASLGLSTLRSVDYGAPRPDGQRWGNSGQSATQLVLLERPIRSWSAAPIGQSDRPDSPHFSDQAEGLFSPGRLKSTWWTPEQLANHIESRQLLKR